MERRLRYMFRITAIAGAMALPAGAVTLTPANVEVVKAAEAKFAALLKEGGYIQ